LRHWRAICLTCALLAIVGGLAALAIDRGGDVHYGDVGGWFGGFGSILAAVAAVGIAVHTNNVQNSKENRERAEAEARALRRSRRITVRGDLYDTQDPAARILNTMREEASFSFELRNSGNTPIYEVTCATCRR
jgi:acyl-coenzyme A thioesterase PaaI-like protein